MTVVTSGSDEVIEQITKQLNKLIDVIKVYDYTETPSVARELALIKVNADTPRRAEIMQICDIFRARIVDIGERTFVIECTGDPEKIDALKGLLEPYGIRELVRTGKIVLARGGRGAAEIRVAA